MEIALLFLLLPVAAASGWWIGKRNLNRAGGGSTAGLSSEYFAGLNYLLNEQPDKAIDVFIKMLDVNSDTVETYLALGNLFRRRGEGDRAIRIHQNLIARPTLTKEQRTQALYELGKDYLRAGIFSRAENLFLELIDDKIHRVAALRNLLDIYEQERDWEKSIATARKIESCSNQKMGAEIAQYYCEQAEMAIKSIEYKAAMKLLKKALGHDKRCVRASLLIGNIEKSTGNHKAAIRAFKQVGNQDPTYISEALEPMVACHEALGKIDEMAGYLNQVLKQHDGIMPIVALSEVTRLQHDEQAAADQIMLSLQRTPSISGLNQLIKLNLINSQGKMREQLSVLNDIMAKLIDNNPVYKCNNCGFRGKSLHWHCPTCRQWCSVKPIQLKENDKYS